VATLSQLALPRQLGLNELFRNDRHQTNANDWRKTDIRPKINSGQRSNPSRLPIQALLRLHD
jgi:hypothetical protein